MFSEYNPCEESYTVLYRRCTMRIRTYTLETEDMCVDLTVLLRVYRCSSNQRDDLRCKYIVRDGRRQICQPLSGHSSTMKCSLSTSFHHQNIGLTSSCDPLYFIQPNTLSCGLKANSLNSVGSGQPAIVD